jgi:hypothetical protein
MSFTVEAWIKPLAGRQGIHQVVASHDVVGGLDFGYELSVIRPPDPNPRIQGRVCTGAASPLAEEVFFARPDAEFVGTDWMYVVLTYDGLASEAKLYVDNVLQQTQQTKANVLYTPNSGQPLRIAAGRTAQQASPADFFGGAIDEVAVYNVPLGADEIAKHFAASGR